MYVGNVYENEQKCSKLLNFRALKVFFPTVRIFILLRRKLVFQFVY